MTDKNWLLEEMEKARACFCIGPQNGEPYCPCRMRQEDYKERKIRERLIAEGWKPPRFK